MEDNYTAMTDHLQLCGYAAGVRQNEFTAEDQTAVEASRCEQCGGRLVYRPWSKTTSERSRFTGQLRISYRAFAVCGPCNAYQEF